MSTVGDPEYGAASPEAIAVLLTARRRPTATRSSRGRPTTPSGRRSATSTWTRHRTAGCCGYDRSFYPEGAHPPAGRDLRAAAIAPRRCAASTSPFLVIHGLDDTLIDPSGGRRTAELVPGAHLLELADMGHDLPEPLWPLLTAAIVGVAAAATCRPASGSAVTA